jgi:LysM repeat protein
METRRTSIVLRILAPLALVIAGVALVMIVTGSNTSGSADTGQSAHAAEKARDLGTAGEDKAPPKKHSHGNLPQKYYIVKSGDTLGAISETTGIPIDKLQSLNPGLDQFSLRSGQKIKLR